MEDYESHLAKAWQNGFNVQDRFKEMSVEEIKAYADADRLPFAVVCLNLERDLNISAIVRSAHGFGAERVYAVGWRKVDARGMVGCQHYTNYNKIRVQEENMDALIQAIQSVCDEHNYIPVFAEWNEHSQSLNSESFSSYIHGKKPLLIMGNENRGVPVELMNHFDNKGIFHIQQRGVIRSLNVANAAAVFMYKISNLMEE